MCFILTPVVESINRIRKKEDSKEVGKFCLARHVDFVVTIMTHTHTHYWELVYYCGAVILWSYFLSAVNASRIAAS